ncbi:helix-turn-helix domain-containing protein [Spirillospora sp. CA-255316]
MSGLPPSLRSWMSAVTSISRAVNAAEPLEGILDRVADRACALIEFDFCAVMLADPAHEVMTMAGWSGLSAGYVELLRREGSLDINPGDSGSDVPATRAYREARTITVPDVRDAQYELLAPLAPAQGYRSLLAAPLRGPEEVLGMLVGYFEEPHAFDPVEVELAELLAEQTAIAIHTARLRAAQQKVISELSVVNDELRRGRAQLDWAERQHRRLMQLVLDDIGLGGLVTALADILQASVTVQDTAGHVLAGAANGDYVPPSRLRAERDTSPDHYEVMREPGDGPETWVAPVVLGGELVGRLWVVGDSAAPDPGRRHLIERFALVIGVEVLKQRHLVEVRERLSVDLLVDLLRPDGITRPHALLERAMALGHDLASPHWLAILTADFRTTPPPVARAVLDMTATPPVLAGRHGDALVLLIPADHDPLPLLRRIHKRVGDQCATSPVTSVLASRVTRLDDYPPAHQVAVRAARLRRSTGHGGLIDLRRLSVTTLLLMTSTVPEQLRRFADQLIAPLAAYDRRRGTCLVATLRAWLDAGFSTGGTAEVLVVHVNTVGYRLTKIEKMSGRDLRDPETRLELRLALHVWDILQAEGNGSPA